MNFFKSKFFIITAIITVLIVALMILSTAFSGAQANPVSNALGIVTTPVQRAITGIGNGISGIFSGVGESKEYRRLYEQSQERVTQLEAETRELDTLRNENNRLRALLDFKEKDKTKKQVAAKVSAKNPSGWYSDFTIDKGSDNGIKQNDVVVTDKGLVGYISQVGTSWSKVVTVLDSATSVGCVAPRTDDRAIIEGDAQLVQSGVCTMNYISKDATVVVGDSVETQGMGSMYPQGILIGKISEITPDLQGLYNKATVKTAVDFGKLSEVLVIVG